MQGSSLKSNIEKDRNKGREEKHIELKLWIKDLITVEKPKEEEFYSFCGLHINIVDVYGVIVSVKSNNYGVLYKVDDGTGEIDCWQDNKCHMDTEKLFQYLETPENSFEGEDHLNETSMQSSIFSPCTEVYSTTFNSESEFEVKQWLREQIICQLEKSPINLGDTVQIRGKLSDFRGDRCIRVYNMRRVTDINEETDRRFELIHLYQTVYFQRNRGFP